MITLTRDEPLKAIQRNACHYSNNVYEMICHWLYKRASL
ncbi:hypothetical protein NOR51B_1286 [Luminiphilus syltensis NOR5-1B]|uniref:Uncharacterized protein n=1 Tax=Luminiphilus syltensis NOR5-1B TaxID=565045 RepID=B8KXF5_9GAMM|nr:hypothetical protein NOR51B_1286 [Luminiphilus syltensis NOR5-1B]